jgi:hypothetical protein
MSVAGFLDPISCVHLLIASFTPRTSNAFHGSLRVSGQVQSRQVYLILFIHIMLQMLYLSGVLARFTGKPEVRVVRIRYRLRVRAA